MVNFSIAAQETVEILEQFASTPNKAGGFRIRANDFNFSHSVNSQKKFRAGSLTKIVVAIAAELYLRENPDFKIPLDQLVEDNNRSFFKLLTIPHEFSLTDLISLSLGSSDNSAANWLVTFLGEDRIRNAAIKLNLDISWESFTGSPFKILAEIDIDNSFNLLDIVTVFPFCQRALSLSLNNSRIPLAINDDDIKIFHKTASLNGLAHDVATLIGKDSIIDIAFFTDKQNDTVVASLEMGVTTRKLLDLWDFTAARSIGY